MVRARTERPPALASPRRSRPEELRLRSASALSLSRPAQAIAVGTAITGRPPHRSGDVVAYGTDAKIDRTKATVGCCGRLFVFCWLGMRGRPAEVRRSLVIEYSTSALRPTSGHSGPGSCISFPASCSNFSLQCLALLYRAGIE
jgi:hypothetical protein